MWIENVHGETFVDYNVDLMKYSDFFNKEFVLFSQASVTRAIPVRYETLCLTLSGSIVIAVTLALLC